MIRHIEIAIYANNPNRDIGDDFTFVSGHNTMLNEKMRQSVSLFKEIATLLDNARQLERLV